MSEVEMTENETMQALHGYCVDVSGSLLARPDNDVPPFLVLVWVGNDDQGPKTEFAMMDASMFLRDRGGLGKMIMMSLIRKWLAGEPRALSMVSDEDGVPRSTAPQMIAFVTEAWLVSRPVVPGQDFPVLDGAPAEQPDRQDVVMIQIHRTGTTTQFDCPLLPGADGKRHLKPKPFSDSGEGFGTLSVRTPDMAH
ncbi:hypothetical protein [Ottowia sp.]|uniref:hypothetical protein n=1 Tax=Ottowia sp. TaxID=1898956 RepID=UPI0025ECF850|nr:hypothetical protein [Ottowia sp.]MBK6616441.1 hypothetical protein [Ottowia sp.]